MNAERLLAHYEKIADAPEAIVRLRRFVLDLAVRGKLVPQNPNDEPASELLKRIAKEKARLVKAGEIKVRSISSRDRQKPIVFDAPIGWSLTELGEVALKITDGAHKAPTYVERGVPFVSVKDFSAGSLDLSSTRFIPEHEHKLLYQRCDPRRGDILLGRIGTLGKAVLVDTDIEFSLFVSVGLVRFDHRFVNPDFFRLLLNSPFVEAEFDRIKIGGGTHTNKLNLGDLYTVALPLPPLAEQRRIVAKVDELTGLCDRLAAARAGREAVRDRLAAASLARLNAHDPDTFHNDARFALDALPALTTRPDQIKTLRQTILNLAVRGKLVPQDANDEPASDLLTRISALPWTKKRKLADLEPDNDVLAEAFPLPRGWEWASVDALVRPNETVTYGILKPEWVADGVPTVRVTEMKTGTIDVANLPKCDPARAAKFKKTTLATGDLLVSKDGTIGKTAFVPPELVGGNITQHVLRFPICDVVKPQYVRLAIDAPFCQSWMAGETKGVALQGVNVGDFRRMPIPLPPLAEQHRIVAKVDVLMALCDRLEASLTATAATRRRLLDALLAEALAPAGERELEAAE